MLLLFRRGTIEDGLEGAADEVGGSIGAKFFGEGIGAAVAGLLLVPGVNLIALGVGTTGATLAALELEAGPPPR